MKKTLLAGLALSLIGCGGSGGGSNGSSGDDSLLEGGESIISNPAELKLDIDASGLSYSAFRVNSGTWNKLTSNYVSVDVNMVDDIEVVAICGDKKTLVERIKVRGSISLDYSWCNLGTDKNIVNFETDPSNNIVGLSSSLSVSSNLTGDTNKAALEFKGDPKNSQASLLAIGKEAGGNTFYIYQNPSISLSSGSTYSIDFGGVYSKRVLAISAGESEFPAAFNQKLHFPSGQSINLTALTGALNQPASVMIDKTEFEEGVYFSDSWSFGESSLYIETNSSQFTGNKLPLSDQPEEIDLADISISQDALTVSFNDKPYVGNNLIIDGYELSFIGHNVTYNIDPLLMVGNKSVTILDFSSLPYIDAGYLPGNTIQGVSSIKARYVSTEVDSLRSAELTIGSK